MRASAFSPFLLLTAAVATVSAADSNIWVTSVPDHVRPYAIAHYDASGCILGQQVYRFPVTGPSSDNAFTLISTNAPGASDLGVLPHLHKVHYENFFNLKGRFQLWTEKDGDEQTRILLPGDYGAVPENTTHTFQILDPDTEMVGVIQPGGFEVLFYALASANWTGGSMGVNPPYDPSIAAGSSPGGDETVITALEAFDVYAQLGFSPRMDAVNGAAGVGSDGWHGKADALGANSTSPYFVAKDYGTKYLVESTGDYQVIQPFVTPVQSAGNFSMSTITLSRFSRNATTSTAEYKFPNHLAFEVLDGMLTVKMLGETIELIQGDVVFVPGNTTFSYWSEKAAFTKALFIGAGDVSLDTTLIEKAVAWDSPVWPVYL